MKKGIIISIIAVLVLGGGVFAYSQLKPTPSDLQTEDVPTPTTAYPTVSTNVQVDLNQKSGGAVQLSVKNVPTDVESIEYEISYMTGSGIPRGVLGKIKTDGKSSVTRDDITLGTCSSGKCVIDSGVTSVDLSLKFNTPDGSSIFRKTYPLTQ